MIFQNLHLWIFYICMVLVSPHWFYIYVKFNITHTQFPVELGEWQREKKMSVTISIEYMKKFLAELGRLFPEKKSFLGIVLKTVVQISEFRSNVKKDLVWGNNCVIE